LNQAIRAFREAFPNIDVDLSRHSFRTIRDGLSMGSLDAAVTLDFDITGASGLETLFLRGSKALLAVHASHPLAGGENLSFGDFKEDIFIVPEDTSGGLNKRVEDCRSCGFYPNIKHAKNLHAAMLAVEAGLGVSIMNDANSLRQNPNIALKDLHELKETGIVLAWNPDSENFILPPFIEAVRSIYK
jgi:DNA-binding transcriptional LysR family regulator